MANRLHQNSKINYKTFLDGSVGKESPAMRETQVRCLGWEDPLKKEWVTHSSLLGLPWLLSW